MRLKTEVKMFKKKLERERDRLTIDLGRINHVIDAFDNSESRRPRKGRKLSAAHRAAISAGRKKATEKS